MTEGIKVFCGRCNSSYILGEQHACSSADDYIPRGALTGQGTVITNTPRAGESAAQSYARTREARDAAHDNVNHPVHYTAHPSGVECIQITEHMNFCRGNALKYLWRAGAKGNELEDLKKARWYLDREIARLEAPRL